MISLRLINQLTIFITLFIAYSITCTIANCARAWMAKKMGDSTAAHAGFLTLNPAAHLDPFGVLLLLWIGIGWGKRVPINPYAFYGRWSNLRVFSVYMADVVAYITAAITALLALIFFFGGHVSHLALYMVQQNYISLEEFTTRYPQYSSAMLASAVVLVAVIYMSIFWAVISFIVNAFDLVLWFFYPELFERKERDYLLIFLPLLFMIVFALPLKAYALNLVHHAGTMLAHMLGVV